MGGGGGWPIMWICLMSPACAHKSVWSYKYDVYVSIILKTGFIKVTDYKYTKSVIFATIWKYHLKGHHLQYQEEKQNNKWNKVCKTYMQKIMKFYRKSLKNLIDVAVSLVHG